MPWRAIFLSENAPDLKCLHLRGPWEIYGWRTSRIRIGKRVELKRCFERVVLHY